MFLLCRLTYLNHKYLAYNVNVRKYITYLVLAVMQTGSEVHIDMYEASCIMHAFRRIIYIVFLSFSKIFLKAHL